MILPGPYFLVGPSNAQKEGNWKVQSCVVHFSAYMRCMCFTQMIEDSLKWDTGLLFLVTWLVHIKPTWAVLEVKILQCCGLKKLRLHIYLNMYLLPTPTKVSLHTYPTTQLPQLNMVIYWTQTHSTVIFWTHALSTDFKRRMAIFIVILMDYSNGFNSHLVQFHPFLSGAAISKTFPENFPVFEPFEKCLLVAAYSCQKLLEFLWVFISHNHNRTWFAFIPTISNNSITLFNLKI